MRAVGRVPMLLVLVATLAAPVRAEEAEDKTPRGKVLVLAAASLRAAFEAMAIELKGQFPGLDVELSFAGTPTLVQQISDGARADVFASADEPSMARVAEAGGLASQARIFTHNRLAIIVPRGNAKRIASLADLTKPGVTVALCAPAVPAGRYAAEAFRKAGLTPPEASQEADVKAVVGKASLGEIDAGVVYVTDAMAAGGTVEWVVIPEAQNISARYPIATLKEAPNPVGAQAFMSFVLSPLGQEVLARFGFMPVGPS